MPKAELEKIFCCGSLESDWTWASRARCVCCQKCADNAVNADVRALLFSGSTAWLLRMAMAEGENRRLRPTSESGFKSCCQWASVPADNSVSALGFLTEYAAGCSLNAFIRWPAFICSIWLTMNGGKYGGDVNSIRPPWTVSLSTAR